MPFLIYVGSITFSTLHLDVEPNDTIQNIKEKIEDKEGISAKYQIIIFSGQQLLQNDKTLSYYGVHKECSVLMLPLYSVESIYIKIQNGKTIKLNVEPLESITNIKNKIAEKEGISSKQQILIYSSIELNDNKLLWDYNIQKESKLHLKLINNNDMDNKFISNIYIESTVCEYCNTINNKKEYVKSRIFKTKSIFNDEKEETMHDALNCDGCNDIIPIIPINWIKNKTKTLRYSIKKIINILQNYQHIQFPYDIIICILQYWLDLLINKRVYSIYYIEHKNKYITLPLTISSVKYQDNKIMLEIKMDHQLNFIDYSSFWIDLMDENGDIYVVDNNMLNKYNDNKCWIITIQTDLMKPKYDLNADYNFNSNPTAYLKTYNGQLMTFNFLPNHSMMDLKIMLYQNTGFLPQNQKFYYYQEHQLCRDCVSYGHVLHAAVKLFT